MTVENEQRKRRSRANGRRTKKRLLSSAVSIWSEFGMLGVTVSAVAEHAGTTRRTVYHHFPTQENLLEEAERFMETELVAIAGGNIAHVTDPYVMAIGLVAEKPELIRSLLLRLLQDDPYENPIFANGVKFWSSTENVVRLKEGVSPQHAQSIFVAMLYAATLTMARCKNAAERRIEVERFATTYKQLVTNGILTKAD